MKSPLLMINLLSALYWFDDALQAALKTAGWQPVSRAQSLLLANIAAGEHRASRLARNLGVTRQAVGQMLNELVARDLIVMEPDPDDGRARIATFSPTAVPLRQAAIEVLESLEEELARRIGAQTMRGLRTALGADWGPSPIVRLMAMAPAQAASGKS